MESRQTSAIDLENNDIESYEWDFLIPPRSFLKQNLRYFPMHYHKFKNMIFNSGTLGKIKHTWDFFIGYTGISLNLRIIKSMDIGHFVHMSEIRLISKGVVTCRIGLPFNPVDENEDSDDSSDSPQQQDYYSWWCDADIMNEIWGDEIDTLTVILNVRSTTKAKCISLSELDLNQVEMAERLEIEKPRDDASQFFYSDFLSDVTLVCENEEIPAHRFLLSSRSEVFKCMFKHDMKESMEGRVLIEDIDISIFKEMIRYMYTGKANIDELYKDLFKAADRYNVVPLKIECAQQFLQRVTSDNAFEVYALGEAYSEPVLQQKALSVIKSDKLAAIRDPKKFQELSLRFPELMYELFRV